MKVILRRDFEQLGKVGDTIEVKNGFARNYLIPRQLAFAANKGNLRALQEEKKQLVKKDAKILTAAKQLAAELEKVSVTLTVKVGDEDKMFGTVTSQMIADSIKEKGFEIDKRKIEIDEPIKALGIYNINIKLHPEVSASVKTWVVRE